MSTVHTVLNPATARPVTDVPLATRRGGRRRHRARARGVPVLAGDRPRRAGGAAAPVRRGRRRARRGARRARGAQRRPHLGQRPLGGGQRPRLPELLRRRARAALRPADPGRRRHRRHLPRAARRRRHHRALELPDADRRLGLRPRARRRQHGGAQAGRAHAADRDPARRAGARGRACPSTCSPSLPGKGSVVGERFVTHPLVRKVCFTGSTAVGKRIMAGCAEQVKRVTLELGGKSANIVFADADIAAAAAVRAVRRLRQRRPGLLRPLADPGASDRRTTSSCPGSSPPSPGCGCSTRATRRARWARSSRPSQQRTVQGYLDEVEVAFAGTTPRWRRLLGAAERGDHATTRQPGSGARRCSARSWP